MSRWIIRNPKCTEFAPGSMIRKLMTRYMLIYKKPLRSDAWNELAEIVINRHIDCGILTKLGASSVRRSICIYSLNIFFIKEWKYLDRFNDLEHAGNGYGIIVKRKTFRIARALEQREENIKNGTVFFCELCNKRTHIKYRRILSWNKRDEYLSIMANILRQDKDDRLEPYKVEASGILRAKKCDSCHRKIINMVKRQKEITELKALVSQVRKSTRGK